jgi:VanZ family protein
MFWRFNAFGISWSLLVISFSLIPGDALPGISFGVIPIDFVVHVLLYWLLCLLVVVGLLKQTNYLIAKINAVPLTLLYSNILGLVLEVCQLLINGRTFDVVDLLANLTGALLGILTYYILYKW